MAKTMKTLNGYEIVDNYARTQIENTYNKEEIDVKFGELSGQISNQTGGKGWTSEQITLFETLANYLVFSDAITGQAIFDNLIASLRMGASDDNTGGGEEPDTPVIPDEPDEPTGYTITNSLVNVTTDNNASSVVVNGSYTANLTANSGYYIDTVAVTMSGVNITDTVYADGVITIPEVTGNVVIVANGAKSDNLIVLSECTSGETMPDGSVVTKGTWLLTPFIEVTPSTTYKTNLGYDLPSGVREWNQKIYEYDNTQTYVGKNQINFDNDPNGNGTVSISIPDSIYYVRLLFHVENTKPYFGLSGVNV